MAERPEIALVVVDMLSAYNHEDADKLMESVEKIVAPVADLVDRAGGAGVETIYVNDNYDDWNSSQEKLVRQALDGARPDLVEPVLPPDDASFVLKARHTIFYGTPLEYLLYRRNVGHIILVGQVTEQCILYSALDAYVRHIRVSVPPDAVAHIHKHLADAALEMMERNMRAALTRADRVL